jgi:membrane protease YdiL (CAAX protease family)
VATVLAAWRRLPVVVRAVVSGLAVAIAGTGPWALLVAANLRYWPSLPWAVPITAVYLWLFWRYIRGEGWPRATSGARRESCRANAVSEDVWGMAVFAGLLGLVAILFLQTVLGRLVRLPQQQEIDPSKYPVLTVAMWVLMSAAVAGVVEEAGFRGYMQRPIERRHGPAAAILIVGTAFGFLHFTHAEATLALMPFYLAVAAVYGTLAYLTDSIFPGMVLHAGGNVFVAFNLFVGGRSEWEPLAPPRPLVWEAGADWSFWMSGVMLFVAGGAAVAAFSALRSTARQPSGRAPGH